MSMFEAVFPDSHRKERLGMLLALVGDPREPLLNLRLRDAWVEKAFGPTGDSPIIAVYTRNGGGNRECYCEDYDEPGTCIGCRGDQATEHPAYLYDVDDEFDSTYRTYRFKITNPNVDDEIRALLLENAEDEPLNMSEHWLRVIEAMGG